MPTRTARSTSGRSTDAATGRRAGATAASASNGNGSAPSSRVPGNWAKGQEPAACSFPAYESSLGDEALELAATAGLVADAHQAEVIRHAMGVRADGKWSAFEVGVIEPRQNGKGGMLEIRELASVALIPGDKLIIHSAHEFATAMEAFARMEGLLEESGLDKQLKPRGGIQRAHGSEGFSFIDGTRLRYRTRTKGGGKGFACDLLIFDEAFELPAFKHGALLPTLSAKPSPQVWYTSSAVDQEVHDDGIVLSRVRHRGRRGDKSLAYFEWAALDADDASPADLDESMLTDRTLWKKANPAYGIRIAEEHIANELASMDSRTFAVERYGVGDWFQTELGAEMVIPLAQWDALLDLKSKPLDPVCFAFDVTPNRTAAAIGVTGLREDGLAHVELVEHRKGTGWLVDRIVELDAKHSPALIVCDGASPAAASLSALKNAGVEVETTNAGEHAQACGQFYDLVVQSGLRQLGHESLRSALKGAKTRPLREAWAWARTKSTGDISPLVAVTLALWATLEQEGQGWFEPQTIAVA